MRVVLQSDRASHWLAMAAAPVRVFSLYVTLLASDGTRCLILFRADVALQPLLLLHCAYTVDFSLNLRSAALGGQSVDVSELESQFIFVSASGISCELWKTSMCFDERETFLQRFLHVFHLERVLHVFRVRFLHVFRFCGLDVFFTFS